MHSVSVFTFQQWRDAARRLLAADVHPSHVHWSSERDQASLFEDTHLVNVARRATGNTTQPLTVSKKFIDIARQVACHRDLARWDLLYRTLWRLQSGEPHLLQLVTDDDVYRLLRMDKAVARDVHKMHAFVRFRKVTAGDAETFVAWHRPDHRIVPLAAPFFARRFHGMTWSILTPDESVYWDQQELRYGPGIPSAVTDDDALEDLWRTYYASIFNPARVKVATMKREMPVRHWPTLPETRMIPELLASVDARVDAMLRSQTGFEKTAAAFLPEHRDLRSLAEAASVCTACELHCNATQTVFGEGASQARIVLVGEKPGDREDLSGQPFVGPAGRLLDETLAAAGIERSEVYITNVVKHFKFTMRGKLRLHQKPNSREIYACRPWLEAELEAIKPHTLVCLGVTAAQAIFGREFRMNQSRGQPLATDFCARTLATWHPAAILRMPNDTRRLQMQNQLLDDLQQARRA